LKCLKNKGFLSLILLIGLIYGCGGGGSSTGGGGGACNYTPLTGNKFKISIKENGIYVITPGILKSFCIDSTGTSLSSFKLQNYDPNTSTMIDIPVNMDQGNMEFYGVGVNRNDYTALNADYTETNVYWLVPLLSGPQPTMLSKPPPPPTPSPTDPLTTLHVEQNNDYWPDMLNGAGYDHWFWERFIIASSPYTFTVNNYDTLASTPITLSFSVTSQTPTSPHSLTALTTNPVFNPPPFTWTDTVPHVFSYTSTGSITNGTLSSLQFPTTSPSDIFYFNWLELEYPGKAYNDQIVFHGDFSLTGNFSFSINGFTQSAVELFDVSNPKTPSMFSNPVAVPSGGGYQLTFSDTLSASIPNKYIALTPAQRKTPANITLANGVDLTLVTDPYDYLIITHENFLTNIQPLATYRESGGGGHQVYIAKIGDVYDSYSGGIFTPQAIKDFLKSAYSGWSTQYVLLVGDASIDFKNYAGNVQENYVPTYLMEYSMGFTDGQTHGQTPSDYWFVQNPNCISVSTCYPIIALGRLPGKTGAEVDTMVNKIIGYETVNKPPSTASWNKNVLFVSGSDSAGTFDTGSDSLALLVSGASPGYQAVKLYYNTTSGMTTTIEYNINNGGALVTNYMGHGSVGFWANCFGLPLQCATFFESSNVANLTNSTKLTFLVTLDCNNGMFAGYGEGSANNPYSIAETFLKSGTGGSVASFSPTGQGYTTNHKKLATELYQTIFGTRVLVIGDAIKQAETTVLGLQGSSAQDLETFSIFVLLGDPATQLAVP
jgi:hypothetical protein